MASGSIRHSIGREAPVTPVEHATRILRLLFADYGPPDFTARLWDGSTPIRAEGTPRFTLNFKHPAALRHMFLPPSERRLGEAFVFGGFDIEGDTVAAAGLVEYFPRARLAAGDLAALAADLLALPRGFDADTMRPGMRARGARHSARRDRETVRFHYDVSNDFYALWLDERMVYSCGYFISGEEDIHTAQVQKLDHICRKLRLRPGDRLLDIGCGWGGLVMHAAQHYDAEAVGITLSEPQAALARERIAAAGLADRASVEVVDYREIEAWGPFDKLVSVGMFEHVGAAMLPLYFEQAWALLRPGGLFLNHGISSMTGRYDKGGPLKRMVFRPNSFMDRYVFPDGELVDIHETLAAAEGVGFEVLDVEALREHYALTLRHWVRRLEAARDAALAHVDEATYRVWRLYMAGCAYGFASSRTNVYQALLGKPLPGGASGQPWTRGHVYGE